MKQIKDFPNYYITENGEVWSKNKKDFLKNKINRYGYHYVILYNNGIPKTLMIHKLVAENFILNPNNFTQINHKDENKNNNCVNNLEWCDEKYNANYGTRNQRISRQVYCIETKQTYSSEQEAARETNICATSISKVCHNTRKTAGGLHWIFI